MWLTSPLSSLFIAYSNAYSIRCQHCNEWINECPLRHWLLLYVWCGRLSIIQWAWIFWCNIAGRYAPLNLTVWPLSTHTHTHTHTHTLESSWVDTKLICSTETLHWWSTYGVNPPLMFPDLFNFPWERKVLLNLFQCPMSILYALNETIFLCVF